MTRCMGCNALLTRGEDVCMECGQPAVVRLAKWPRVLVNVVTALFYCSLGMTLASFFLPLGMGVMKGLLLTAALLFLRRSAQDFLGKTVAH